MSAKSFQQTQPRRNVSVAIIGAGMSGLCMAAKLQDAGVDDFTIFESADEVGGTWRDNTYPGLHCDVPSRYYTYSFRPNPEWSHMLPPGPEVQQYFRQVATERGMRSHIRFCTDVTDATYQDGKWWVTTAAGVEKFDVLVTATGVLRIPRYPDIQGLETFTGPTFHSSRWDHSVSLPDKRIGLIGTGSTGVQITAELGGEVKQLKVFQRTAQWICPWPNVRVSTRTKAAMRRWPWLNAFGYWFWSRFVRLIFGVAPVRPGWQRWLYQTQCRWNLRLSVRDRELKAKLTPRDQPMCKRMIFAGHFYRAVQKPGVEIITDPIDRIEPRGVVTANGTLHEVDLLVLATGFDAHAYVRPLTITGDGGRTLEEAWADGPTAYRSIGVPGFPNMFMLMGPHSPVGNDSLIHIAENQANYVMWWIDQLREGRIISASPTETATKAYNEEMKAAMPQTVWLTGCSSWYLNKDGLPELFPWDADRYPELLRAPEVTDFDVRTS
jgi:cation diffusion facilitator CzcD-associated flavoprotein CzcO